MFAFSEDDGLIINTNRNGDKFFKFRPYDLKKNSHLYQEYGIANHYERFRQDHLSEERRIWYVAMTRAKHLLYLSCPRTMPGSVARGSIPDFFQEICDEFGEADKICRFQSFKDRLADEAELPLWKSSDKPAFGNIEEAEEYGKRLIELISSRQK